MWKPDLPEGAESVKIKYEIVPYTRGRVLDIGSGPWKAFPHFVGVDNRSEWYGQRNPDVLCDGGDLSLFASQSVDSVFSSHLLEHFEKPKPVLKEWWRVIKNGGYLVLYLPHKSFYPNMGTPESNPYHKHDFLPKDIIAFMKEVGSWDLVVSEERNQDDEYSFFQVFKKISDKCVYRYSYTEERPKKTCGIVRYGGYGDMIQTSSIFPALKAQGYHITLYTTPSAYEIVMHDPNLDAVILQDTNQVPNFELVPYWDVHKKKYDKWINLSESVEGTFLALNGRPQFFWNKEAREFLLDKNYLEFTHVLAGVPFKPSPRFHATELELFKAKKRRAKIAGPVIMWTLAGSSVHKVWPHMDQVLAHFMLNTDYHVVFVGDEMCQMLEDPWVKEPRMHLKSGKWNIRETLAFAEQCDFVVGPETGVMNAVGFLDMPKILFLSHSSRENLSRDWINCEALSAEDCKCQPCHKMINNYSECTKNEEFGTSDCQAKITPEMFMDAFNKLSRPKIALRE